jgi:uncharacterized membrane protein
MHDRLKRVKSAAIRRGLFEVAVWVAASTAALGLFALLVLSSGGVSPRLLGALLVVSGTLTFVLGARQRWRRRHGNG